MGPQTASRLLLVAVTAFGCAAPPQSIGDSLPDGAEAVSLLGAPLIPPAPSAERQAVLEQDLADARAAYAADPSDADAIIWMGRRLAYLGEYRAAIGFFSEGAAKHSIDARMLRHRGHRWITLRQFDRAVSDLAHASKLVEGQPDRVEPDGAPNPAGVPIGSLHSNIDYHLALAHYLRGEYDEAGRVHERRMGAAENDDRICSTAYWLVLIRHRLGDEAGVEEVLARIRPDMNLLENFDYHRLLLVYKGDLTEGEMAPESDSVASATVAYGLAQLKKFRGDDAGYLAALRDVVTQPQWAAFGFIAAEAELAASR